jgi:hypothetical protein
MGFSITGDAEAERVFDNSPFAVPIAMLLESRHPIT